MILLIAEDDERFVPTYGGIYAYSLNGSDRSWVLPEEFRNARLKVYEMTEKGRSEFKNFSLSGNMIHLKLENHQAVKIIKE